MFKKDWIMTPLLKLASISLSLAAFTVRAGAQSGNGSLGLSNGISTFQTPSFTLQLVNDSQTVFSLRSSNGLDFVPSDQMQKRDSDGQYHLGDITFRVRLAGAGASNSSWFNGDSAQARHKVNALPPSSASGELAVADLTPTLPNDTTSLINVTRSWVVKDGRLQMLFNVTNSHTSSAVEIGSIGAPLEFNNVRHFHY